MNSISTSIVLAIALLLTTAACSLLPDRPSMPAPALHDFGFSEKFTASQAAASEAAAWSSVSVDAPQWLQNENISFRLLYADPTRVRFYAQDRWLASPAAMLAQRLSMASGRQGWRLKITLLEFEQVFDGPEKARMVLVFRASAHRPDSEEIVGEKLFSLSLSSPTVDAKGAVTASAMLVGDAVKGLDAWVGGLPVLLR